jgi:AcrR family transcriptional regulator
MASGRTYRSPLRAQQAAATRARILEAARGLLLEQGYSATRLDEIARQAGVALPTLTGYFPNKPALLQAVVRSFVRGSSPDGDPPMGEQLRALLDIGDPRDLLAALAALYRKANERAFELFEIMRKAAAADPKIEEQQRAGAESRRHDQLPVARHLKQRGWLRPEISERQAADILWLYSSADVYRLLVNDRNWAPGRYERWLTSTLIDSLLSAEERAR